MLMPSIYKWSILTYTNIYILLMYIPYMELNPMTKPQYFKKKHKGKYMILIGTDTEYPMPYRDPFTNKQLADTLSVVQRIAFMIMQQDYFESYKGIQVICSEAEN